MHWIMSDPCEVTDLFDDMSPIASQLFSSRTSGLEPSKVKEFFNPKLSLLHSPDRLKDIDKATARVVAAIESGEKISIHGDYDADGVTSSYILYKTLKMLKANVSYTLPNREIDGYGLSSRFVETCLKSPCLVITVDCGISENKKIESLKESGIDVIVTDHHKLGPDGIPKCAYAVVDPQREDSTCSFKFYAGVGISFMLCWSVCKAMPSRVKNLRSYLESLIPYVAIGTIADVMPLIGENRILVDIGLKMIRKGKAEEGLKQLIDISGLSYKSITAKDIGFMVGPRINSAGRMEDPGIAFECFLQGSRQLAAKLDRLNEQRKEISQELFEEAVNIVDSNKEIGSAPILVIPGKEWHHGIIGIVAGKIAEAYGKPTIVLSVVNGCAKGSGRSVQNFNLHAAVSQGADLLTRFGGHAQALGVVIDADKIDEFRDRLSGLFQKGSKREAGEIIEVYADGQPLLIDCEVDLTSVTEELMQEIDQLSPFGEGNPEPVFSVRGASVLDYKPIGKLKNHLSMTAIQDGYSIRGVAFNAESLIEILDDGNEIIDIAFTPVWNTFNGRTTLEMQIKDLKIPE